MVPEQQPSNASDPERDDWDQQGTDRSICIKRYERFDQIELPKFSRKDRLSPLAESPNQQAHQYGQKKSAEDRVQGEPYSMKRAPELLVRMLGPHARELASGAHDDREPVMRVGHRADAGEFSQA